MKGEGQQMNILIIIGMLLMMAEMVVDRFFCEIPDKFAIVIYVISVALIIGGMLQMKG